jgi:RluA family pseudouridine synthase
MTRMGEINVIFEDGEILVVNKPHGISVHNAEDPSNLLLLLNKNKNYKLHPVHRLDKETSGIQLLAKNPQTAALLANEFSSHHVKKIYLGVLRGKMKDTKGVWNQQLSDKAEGAKNPAGLSKDRIPCETHFSVLRTNDYFSLCQFDLKTGRQHQIRKHAALNRHHILGDSRYGDKKYNEKMFQIYKFQRMLLHCSSLSILKYHFESPVNLEFVF